ncbi:hypothetical protein [Thermococcus sp.]|uniref:hypothetical protein n=1 Tax=Thermococcus sp. TaxID=35749 RepID=UPI002633809D|nr:hypothetical protein [Thermococcus sp.]
MKRRLIVLLLIVVIASGCISGESGRPTKTSPTPTTTLLPAGEPRNYTQEELLQNLERITFLRFWEETTGVTVVIIGNANQTMEIKGSKVGYVDIASRRTEVNSTATVGSSIIKSRIIVTNESAYFEFAGRGENLTEPEAVEKLWESTNVLEVVRRYLTELEPFKVDFVNGTQEFYYNVTNTMMLGEVPGIEGSGNVAINGTAILRFRGGYPVEVVFRYTLKTVSEQGGVRITNIVTAVERIELQEIKTGKGT